MPSIHHDTARGHWVVRWREGGKNRSMRGLPSKVAAMARARGIEAEQAARQPLGPGERVTPMMAIDRYLACRTATTSAHREKLAATLRRVITDRNWTAWDAIRPETVQALLPYHSRCVRALLRWATQNGQPVHPQAITAARVKVPRRPQAEIPDPGEVAALVTAADAWHPADGTMVHLIATYGHRAESLIRLRVGAWDSGRRRLDLRVKSGDDHRHPVLPATATRLDALANGRAPTEALLIGHLDRPWRSGSEFAGWLTHSCGNLGVLDLRRYAISRMLALGLDAKTIASITGHRTVSLILNTYARTTDDRQAAALAALAGSPDVPHE